MRPTGPAPCTQRPLPHKHMKTDTPKKPDTRTKIVLSDVRLSYPALFEPRTNKLSPDKKAEYSAVFILDKKKHAKVIAAIQAAVKQAATDKWGAKGAKAKSPLRDGADAQDDEGNAKDGYGDKVMFISAKSLARPQVMNRRAEPEDDEEALYGGCYVNAVISFYTWEHPQNGKGVSANLGPVQFVRPGERFGATPIKAEDHFTDLGEDDDTEEEDMLG